jgi:hypothetical protein
MAVEVRATGAVDSTSRFYRPPVTPQARLAAVEVAAVVAA